MKNLFLFYVVAQSLSTAFGLSVIESVTRAVKTELKNKGYVIRRNNNSLYKFNDGIVNFAKGLIPFYYAIKAVSLISGDNVVEKEVKKGIEEKRYVTTEEAIEAAIQAREAKKETVIPVEPQIVFEKPEKYTARKNDNTLYDTYITPIEYVTKEIADNNELHLTPFMDDDKVVEHVVVKEDVTKQDIVKAISELSSNELEVLNNTISALAELKRKNEGKSLSLKDVA